MLWYTKDMRVQRKALGFFAGIVLFFTFLSLYPIPTHAPVSVGDSLVATPEAQKMEEKEISFTVLDQGDMAPGAKNRKNYAIYNQEELDSFWKLSHRDDTEKAPKIDFDKKYVLVVFAGTKPTTGYEIKVTNIKDTKELRMVEVATIIPGAGCKTTDSKTSPYQFVAVPYDIVAELTHRDTAKTVDCK